MFYIQKHNKLSFREEIKTYVCIAMNSIETRTLEEAKQYLDDYKEWREETKKVRIHFTKPLTAFRQIIVDLKMMKKSFMEVFFRNSMSNGKGKNQTGESRLFKAFIRGACKAVSIGNRWSNGRTERVSKTDGIR